MGPGSPACTALPVQRALASLSLAICGEGTASQVDANLLIFCKDLFAEGQDDKTELAWKALGH